MNWNRIRGNWKQYTGAVQAKCKKLAEDDFAAVDVELDQRAANSESAGPGPRKRRRKHRVHSAKT